MLLRRDGRETPITEHSTPLQDERGGIDGASLIIRDVTVRRGEQEALRAAQEALTHACRVATMGVIAASIAHEVNQPLAGVVTNGKACLRWLDGLAEPSPALAEARAAVQRIVRDAVRAGEIVARTRTLCRRDASERRPLDLHRLIHETLALIRHELLLHRIELRLNLAAELPTVLGDAVQLQQVLLNLILNGIDAIDAANPARRELAIATCAPACGRVCVEVADSGIGLKEGEIGQIFDAFFTTKPMGLGMGLAISRAIAEQHGGCLRLIPQDGPGATFQFTVPSSRVEI